MRTMSCIVLRVSFGLLSAIGLGSLHVRASVLLLACFARKFYIFIIVTESVVSGGPIRLFVGISRGVSVYLCLGHRFSVRRIECCVS